MALPAALRAHAPAALLCLGVAAHLLFLLSLRFGWLNPLFNDIMHRFGPGGDFFSIYAAGVKARAGENLVGKRAWQQRERISKKEGAASGAPTMTRQNRPLA